VPVLLEATFYSKLTHYRNISTLDCFPHNLQLFFRGSIHTRFPAHVVFLFGGRDSACVRRPVLEQCNTKVFISEQTFTTVTITMVFFGQENIERDTGPQA